MSGKGDTTDSGDDGNKYDADFDAGVKADEDEDPKTFIQQLTGKLSQSLRKYNDSLPKPDSDLCKYVAGMINKQASKGLSEKDVTEILSKVKIGNDDEDADDTKDDIDALEDDGNDSMKDADDGKNGAEGTKDDDMATESISHKEKIDEIYNDIINSGNGKKIVDKPIKEIGFRKKPFTSPTFK